MLRKSKMVRFVRRVGSVVIRGDTVVFISPAPGGD